jgi:hypothetical protein
MFFAHSVDSSGNLGRDTMSEEKDTGEEDSCTLRGCKYEVESAVEQDDNIAVMKAVRDVKSRKGKAKFAARVKEFCEIHHQHMEFQQRILNLEVIDLIVDYLHGLDINIPQLIFKFSFHDPVILSANTDLRDQISSFYRAIDCPLDLLEVGGKSWFHGAAWHYDFTLGANGKSFGLDINVLILALIVYGAKAGEGDDADEEDSDDGRCVVVDDMDDAPAKPAAPARKSDGDRLMALLRRLFGHNATKVRAIFHSVTCYAELFASHNDEWESHDEAYVDQRVVRGYWAGTHAVVPTPTRSSSK